MHKLERTHINTYTLHPLLPPPLYTPIPPPTYRYQVLEARVHGADTLLLIVAILGVRQLSDLMAYSRSLGE